MRRRGRILMCGWNTAPLKVHGTNLRSIRRAQIRLLMIQGRRESKDFQNQSRLGIDCELYLESVILVYGSDEKIPFQAPEVRELRSHRPHGIV